MGSSDFALVGEYWEVFKAVGRFSSHAKKSLWLLLETMF